MSADRPRIGLCIDTSTHHAGTWILSDPFVLAFWGLLLLRYIGGGTLGLSSSKSGCADGERSSDERTYDGGDAKAICGDRGDDWECGEPDRSGREGECVVEPGAEPRPLPGFELDLIMRTSPVEELCGVEVEVDGRPLCPEEEELRWDGCIVRSVRPGP